VGGEDAAVADGLGVVKEIARGGPPLAAAPPQQERERQKGRVALVEVVGLDLEAQRVEHPVAAQAQDRLLLEPLGPAPAIQAAGDGAVAGVVGVEVGVEQQHGDRSAHGRGQLVEPGADPDLAALELDRDHGGQRRAQSAGSQGSGASTWLPSASSVW
jgi:hypothetical protein